MDLDALLQTRQAVSAGLERIFPNGAAAVQAVLDDADAQARAHEPILHRAGPALEKREPFARARDYAPAQRVAVHQNLLHCFFGGRGLAVALMRVATTVLDGRAASSHRQRRVGAAPVTICIVVGHAPTARAHDYSVAASSRDERMAPSRNHEILPKTAAARHLRQAKFALDASVFGPIIESKHRCASLAHYERQRRTTSGFRRVRASAAAVGTSFATQSRAHVGRLRLVPEPDRAR